MVQLAGVTGTGVCCLGHQDCCWGHLVGVTVRVRIVTVCLRVRADVRTDLAGDGCDGRSSCEEATSGDR